MVGRYGRSLPYGLKNLQILLNLHRIIQIVRWEPLIKKFQTACAFLVFNNCLSFAGIGRGAAFCPGREIDQIYLLSFLTCG